MSDRVVVLSAGPGTHPIGEFAIDLPRPRDVAEVRTHPRFVELHAAIWGVLRESPQGYASKGNDPRSACGASPGARGRPGKTGSAAAPLTAAWL